MQRSASYNWDDICFMGKRGSPGRPTARSATPEDQAEAQRLTALLEAAAKTASYDHNPQLWDEVLTALNLDICYQVTVAEVLRRETWRNAANPRAYVATAAVRSARGKQLPDYFEREFRRVDSDEPEAFWLTRFPNWGHYRIWPHRTLRSCAKWPCRFMDTFRFLDGFRDGILMNNPAFASPSPKRPFCGLRRQDANEPSEFA